jgi:chitinase
VASALIFKAHQANCKVLITLGGENTGDQFAVAVSSHEKQLIANLMVYVNNLGYDGIDLDIEPIEHRDANWTLIPADSPERIASYQQFVKDLRASMNASSPKLILTAAAIPDYAPTIFGPIQDEFDQINIMTYNMAGLWTGQTWFDSNVSSQPLQPTMPSGDKKVAGYLAAGVPSSKLGIGMNLDGLLWTGALKPGDPITGVTTKYVPLTQIMSQYFSTDIYHWDNTVQSSYLSIPASATSKPLLLVYDDVHSAQAKAAYCKKNGLGGIIIWQLGAGYTPGAKTQAIDDILSAIQSGQQ